MNKKIMKQIAWLSLLIILIVYPNLNIPTKIDRALGQLPVMHDGRIKPLDTLARHTLVQIKGNTRLKNASPTLWFWNNLTNNNTDKNSPIIVVEHPKLFDTINPIYNKQKFRVSESFLDQHIQHIAPTVKQAAELESAQRTRYQQAATLVYQRYITLKQSYTGLFPLKNNSPLTFWNHMIALSQNIPAESPQQSTQFNNFLAYYNTLQSQQSDALNLHLIFSTNAWTSLAEEALNTQQNNRTLLSNYLLLADAHIQDNASKLEQYSNAIMDAFKQQSFMDYAKLKLEYLNTIINPFIVSLWLYIIIILCSFIGYLLPKKNLTPYITSTWGLALGIHAFGMLARSIILMRPPVINLYSSAIFIAFISSIIGYIAYKKTSQLFYAGYISALSALSLIVAYHLSLAGDTLEVMQAVLNSNFWLSTHVVSMTIGYALLFMAGFLAIAYILIGTLTKKLTPEFAKQLATTVYVFLMIALFFNFLGTVLGGIWADQSWGRFWGWDPKENGAILIVLWIAIILHMKWGKLLKTQGMMVMSVLANIVTAWSWKGTNMLGIGLHSYGFTEKTFYWLVLFMLSQIVIAILGALPTRFWTSKNIS